MTLHCRSALVVLAAHKFNSLVEFYSQLLDQKPALKSPGYVEFHLPGLRLGIFEPKAKRQAEFPSVKGRASLCFEVIDLEAAIAHLKKLGCPPKGTIQTASHGREIYACDPANNRLILYEPAQVPQLDLYSATGDEAYDY